MLNVVRFEQKGEHAWGIVESGKVYCLDLPCTSTQKLIAEGRDSLRKLAVKARSSSDGLVIDSVALLSPITQDAKVLCQGANYRQHMIDSGMNPDAKNFNMFFTKSSASIMSPSGEILKPKHVDLLDYEIELTLVMGKSTQGTINVNEQNLADYVAGICIGNDVSARDVQIPQMQFHKGKSYRTFCPLGPYLVLLDADELHYLNDLNLVLSVNGEVRQQDSTSNLVFKPAETLSEFSQIVDFSAGDVLMTGTPSGCALGLPSPLLMKLVGLLPESKKWSLFNKTQKKRSDYLKQGDRLELTISSRDGVIDLGRQVHIVKEEV